MSGGEEFGDDGGAYDIDPNDVGNGDGPRHEFKIISLEELLTMEPPPWVIRKVIRRGEFVVIFGESGCGKTFVVLDLVLKVVMGMVWWGHITVPGRVLYLAGEGAFGLGIRCRAWAQEHVNDIGLLQGRMRILPVALSLMDDEEFGAFMDALAREPAKPDVIVVDTLARYMIGGDENSAADMGTFIHRCEAMREATGATVIIVHHKGKGSQSERGSSALRGASDVMIDVQRDGDDITLVGVKAKDALPLLPVHASFREVWLGKDPEGDLITSLVLQAREAPPASPEEEAEKDPGQAVRQTLATVFKGEASGGRLRDATAEVPRATFYRALKKELKDGRIELVGKSRKVYRLTSLAPEYVAPDPAPSPSLSPTESHTVSETPGSDESDSLSLSLTHPFRGGTVRLRRDDGLNNSQQKKRKPGGARKGRGAKGGAGAKARGGSRRRPPSCPRCGGRELVHYPDSDGWQCATCTTAPLDAGEGDANA